MNLMHWAVWLIKIELILILFLIIIHIVLFNTLEDEIIKEFDGFIIATDPSSHFELAKKVISGKKPLLVEKPLTLDYESSKNLNKWLKRCL